MFQNGIEDVYYEFACSQIILPKFGRTDHTNLCDSGADEASRFLGNQTF